MYFSILLDFSVLNFDQLPTLYGCRGGRGLRPLQVLPTAVRGDDSGVDLREDGGEVEVAQGLRHSLLLLLLMLLLIRLYRVLDTMCGFN